MTDSTFGSNAIFLQGWLKIPTMMFVVKILRYMLSIPTVESGRKNCPKISRKGKTIFTVWIIRKFIF